MREYEKDVRQQRGRDGVLLNSLWLMHWRGRPSCFALTARVALFDVRRDDLLRRLSTILPISAFGGTMSNPLTLFTVELCKTAICPDDARWTLLA